MGGMIMLTSTLKDFFSSDFVDVWHLHSDGKKTQKNSVPCVVIFKQGHFYITLCYLKHRDLVLENSFLLAAKWSRMYREFSKVILWARVCKTSTRYRF